MTRALVRPARILVATLVATFVSGCGGGAGAGNAGNPDNAAGAGPSTTPTLTDALAIVVDQGPAEMKAGGGIARNVPYTSVTICSPGSTTACQTIDHVLVDTASVGLRLMASVLDARVVPTQSIEPVTGKALRQCVQFADGTTWGSVVLADVHLANRTLSSLPVNLLGDAAAGPVPASCATSRIENSVAAFGARGVLGIGHFLQDCGTDCAARAIAGGYYVCPTSTSASTSANACVPTAVALDRQVPNPIAKLASENNGIVITMNGVASPGAATASGTLAFGIGTQASNTPVSSQLIALDSSGTFTTTHDGVSTPGSFIDTGSNGLFFASGLLPNCSSATGFFCPVAANGAPISVNETASIQGLGATTVNLSFRVDNAEQLLASNAPALPGLAGPNAIPGLFDLGTFDWGLPLFFGRSVSLLFEGQALNGTAGPAIGL